MASTAWRTTRSSGVTARKRTALGTVTALALVRLVLSAMTTGCVPDLLSRRKGCQPSYDVGQNVEQRHGDRRTG